jgi:hypothetical protein
MTNASLKPRSDERKRFKLRQIENANKGTIILKQTKKGVWMVAANVSKNYLYEN